MSLNVETFFIFFYFQLFLCLVQKIVEGVVHVTENVIQKMFENKIRAEIVNAHHHTIVADLVHRIVVIVQIRPGLEDVDVHHQMV